MLGKNGGFYVLHPVGKHYIKVLYFFIDVFLVSIFHMDSRQVQNKSSRSSSPTSPTSPTSSPLSSQEGTSSVPSKKGAAGVKQGLPPKKKKAWKSSAFLWRSLAYMGATLFCVVLFIFLGTFAFVKLYPQEISQKISHLLEEETGMKLEFSGIDMTLLPLPALSLAQVRVNHTDFSVDVAYASLRPSLLPLLQGKFSLGDISLWRPHVTVHATKSASDENKASAEIVSAPPSESSSSLGTGDGTSPKKHWGAVVQEHVQYTLRQIPPFVYGSSVEILHGSVLLQQAGWDMRFESLQSYVELGSLGNIEGNIRFDVVTVNVGGQYLAQAEAFSLRMEGDVEEGIDVHVQSKGQVHEFLDAVNVDVSARYTLKENLGKSLVKAFSAGNQSQSQPHGVEGQWKVQANLLWFGAPIAVQSSGSVVGNLQQSLHIQNVSAQLEQDSLRLNAAIHLQDVDNPAVDGHLDVAHLSLTQWFGFARHLPPGIQHALHDITGNLDFLITKQGLSVPRLAATAAGASFTGSGGVPTWSKAVVFLDILSPELYLGAVYPEAEGKRPKPLTFAHKPLTPEPGTAEAQVVEGDDYISVDYDINVAAHKVFAWDLPLEGFKFRVNPAGLDGEKLAAKHKNAAVLAFSAEKFFGGRAEGKALLYRNAQDESAYDITALLRNVQAQRPVERLIGRELFGGRMSADATVSGKGVYAGEFLVSLGGQASLRVENGNFFGRSKQKVPFKLMTVNAQVAGLNPAKISGAQWPPKLAYSGQWKASLVTEDISAKSSWNGALEFIDEDYGTVALHNIPGTVEISFSPELTTLPHSTEVHFSTLLSLNTTKGLVSLSKAKGTVPSLAHMQASGFGEMDFSKDIRWKATVNANTSTLSKVLAQLDEDGRPLLPPTAPQSAKISTEMSYANELLRLQKLQAQVQDMRISGSLQRTFTAKPQWEFDLFADVFDFDLLFRDKKAQEAASAAKAAKAAQAKAQKKEEQRQSLTAGDVPVRKPLPPLVTPVATRKKSERPLSWRWLENFNAKGKVRVGTYIMNKVRVKDVLAPVKIASSTLECTPITGKLYNGPIKVNFKGVVKKGLLHCQVGAQANGAALLRLTEDLELETALAGSADFWLSAQGAVGYASDIPSAFDGTWRLNIGQGFLQSREKGKLTGSPTQISYFKDAGVITKGVLESHKFELKGKDLQATGRGKVDFVNDTLDMNLVVSSGGLSDIPVRFYGSLDDPQRDVHTGAVLLSALGSLGMGVFDLIGGVFGAIFGLFK